MKYNDYKLSSRSIERLDGVSEKLQGVLELAIRNTVIDFGVGAMGGLRTAEEQNYLFNQQRSKINGITRKSKHQYGEAVDLIAYVNGKYTFEGKYYYMLAQAVLGAGKQLGVELRWGGDWDGDRDFDDQTFNDLGHFELV